MEESNQTHVRKKGTQPKYGIKEIRISYEKSPN